MKQRKPSIFAYLFYLFTILSMWVTSAELTSYLSNKYMYKKPMILTIGIMIMNLIVYPIGKLISLLKKRVRRRRAPRHRMSAADADADESAPLVPGHLSAFSLSLSELLFAARMSFFKALWSSTALGVAFGLSFYFYIVALQLSPEPSTVVVLWNSGVVVVFILSVIFLDRPVTIEGVLGVLSAVGGVTLVAMDKQGKSTTTTTTSKSKEYDYLPFLFSLLSALCYSIYTVTFRLSLNPPRSTSNDVTSISSSILIEEETEQSLLDAEESDDEDDDDETAEADDDNNNNNNEGLNSSTHVDYGSINNNSNNKNNKNSNNDNNSNNKSIQSRRRRLKRADEGADDRRLYLLKQKSLRHSRRHENASMEVTRFLITLQGVSCVLVLAASLPFLSYFGVEKFELPNSSMQTLFFLLVILTSGILNVAGYLAVAVISPIFVALASILAIPTSDLYDFIVRGEEFGAMKVGGTICVFCGFLLIESPPFMFRLITRLKK